MNITRRIICLLLCFASLFHIITANVSATESETDIHPRYTSINSIGATLQANSNQTKISFGARISAIDTYPVSLKCYIQFYDAGYWLEISNWSINGVTEARLEKSISVTPGYIYRLVVVGNVYSTNGMLIESDTIYRYLSG